MRRVAAILILLVLLAFDWAALHDIVKGEPDLTTEFATLAFSAAAFCVVTIILRQRRAVS